MTHEINYQPESGISSTAFAMLYVEISDQPACWRKMNTILKIAFFCLSRYLLFFPEVCEYAILFLFKYCEPIS